MSRFHIAAPSWDLSANAMALVYRSDAFGRFEERVVFPDSTPLSELDDELREGLGVLAALAMGTSYFKAAPAQTVSVESALTAPARDIVEKLYGPGLGEFYVRNNLSYPPQIKIVAAEADAARFPREINNDRAVVAFGGGKDSHVASAILNEANIKSERVSVILSDQVGARLQSMSETPVTLIKRCIDPKLIDLSRAGKALNGHVPITAINSIVLGLYAAMTGAGWVVFANERAASEPTMHIDGHAVNHQYSKSLEFEDALKVGFEAVAAPFTYFSILRPVSELWTGHYIANRASAALEIFASCNRNFVFAGPSVLQDGQRWCGRCAKCVYTSVLLAPFLSPERHQTVFQSQPLHNPENMTFLREIAGLTDAKPWECVGERREVASALLALADHAEWKDVPLIRDVQADLAKQWDLDDLRQAWDVALDARSEHRMPEKIAKIVQA